MAVHTEGVKQTEIAFDAMVRAVADATPPTIDKVMDSVALHQRALLSMGWHPPGTPTGSVPPSPPWRISGAYSRSVRRDMTRKVGRYRWAGRVGPSREVPYVRIHELGGVTGRGHRTHLPARPSLKPAWQIVKPTVHRTFATQWARATRVALKVT